MYKYYCACKECAEVVGTNVFQFTDDLCFDGLRPDLTEEDLAEMGEATAQMAASLEVVSMYDLDN